MFPGNVLNKSRRNFTFAGWRKMKTKQVFVSLLGVLEKAGAGSYLGRWFEEVTPGACRKVELREATSAMWSPSDYSTQPSQDTDTHKELYCALQLGNNRWQASINNRIDVPIRHCVCLRSENAGSSETMTTTCKIYGAVTLNIIIP
jgi:hypothetical protein